MDTDIFAFTYQELICSLVDLMKSHSFLSRK